MYVTSATTSSGTASGTQLTTSQESQDQFLQLLVTQIQNQNPLDPMSNEEFTSQLTQFSMLEQLETMNSNMTQDMTYSQSLNNTMMLSLVGKQASVVGDGVTVSEGAAGSSRLDSAGAGTARVEVRDADGEVVRTYITGVDAGWNDVTWDGRLDNGEPAEDGAYTLSVTVTDAGGSELDHQLYESGRVDSIRFENSLAVLSVNGQDYYASEIAEVGI